MIKVVWFQILWKLSLPDICEHPRSSSSSSLKSQWQCHFHLLIHSRCYGNRKANASWGPLWLQWLILFQWIGVKKKPKPKRQIMHHWASLLLFFKNSFWTPTRCEMINHLCESCWNQSPIFLGYVIFCRLLGTQRFLTLQRTCSTRLTHFWITTCENSVLYPWACCRLLHDSHIGVITHARTYWDL